MGKWLASNTSPLYELAFVLVRFDHVASIIVNGITGSCDRLENLGVVDCVADCIRPDVPQPTERGSKSKER